MMYSYRKAAQTLLPILALAIATVTATPTKAQGTTTDTEYHQWAVSATATTQYGDTSWSAQQATGQPNVTACGDDGRAWASKDAKGVDDLTLIFDSPVTPTQVNIHESYHPGFITGIDLVPVEGKPIPVANSADTTTACPGVLSVKVTGVQQQIKGVIIHLDQTKSPGWDEIDAVELVGHLPTGISQQWASGASATSQYGDTDWSASQATGAPNVGKCTDDGHAWASKQSNSVEALTVTFQVPMTPSSVHIYQTFNPGSITGIDLIPADGSTAIPVPNSADSKATPCPGIFMVDVSAVTTPVNGVVIHLDQSKIAGWDEIDAVELVGTSVSSATPAATDAATMSATMSATLSATGGATEASDSAAMSATSAASGSAAPASGTLEATQAATP